MAKYDLDIGRDAWFPDAKKFADIVAPASNYPLSYVYGMFLAISGHVLGRSTFVQYANKIYPNQFICLIGGSGTHHKSTAMNLALETLGEERVVDEFQPIRTVTTSSGLLLTMKNSFGPGFVQLDELASMTQKKRQDFAADLLSRIVELYSCPPTATNTTRKDPIVVEYPYLTFVSASTLEWIRTTLSNTDMLAGFGNRMTWILGDPRPERAWPTRIEVGSFEKEWTRLDRFRGEVYLLEEAREMWEYWYHQVFAVKQADSPRFLQTMAERIPEKVIKAALIAAAWRGVKFIDAPMLRAGIDWGNFCYEGLENLIPAFGQLEERLLAAIKEGHNTKALLTKHLAHEVSAEKIQRSLRAMQWAGRVDDIDGVFLPIDISESVD